MAPTRIADKGHSTRRFSSRRQPILDKSGRIFGYELLYRQHGAAEDRRAGANEDYATAKVIDGLFAIGFDVLTANRKAFINVSRRLLLEGIPAVLPRDKVVLELGADIEADSEVLDVCRQLRKDGYTAGHRRLHHDMPGRPNSCRSRTT